MRRREFLGLAGLCGVAGCLNAPLADGEDTQPPVASFSEGLPVPADDLNRSAPQDGIPAITDPKFGASWSGVEFELQGSDGETSIYRPRLTGDEEVIGIELGGHARAYPLKVLSWHEVVNDDFDGSLAGQGMARSDDPLLVTYCPLCKSGIVARRRVAGRDTVFGVSGLLWRSNLVMYDRATESLWSQIMATAIRGPMTGTTLELVPSTLTTWRDWRGAYPETEVLLPPPLSNTVLGPVRFNYDFNLYEQWERIWERYPDEGNFGGPGYTDTRVQRRELVLGIKADGEARAYPHRQVSYTSVVNDVVGNKPVVVTISDRALVAYDRRVDGRTLEFHTDGETLTAGGSHWDAASGRATDGPFEGTRLVRANDHSQMYWFAWLAFNPDTDVYRA